MRSLMKITGFRFLIFYQNQFVHVMNEQIVVMFMRLNILMVRILINSTKLQN